MRDLIVKLETLKESKERTELVEDLRTLQIENNKALLEWIEWDSKLYTEADMIRHEISVIDNLIWVIKIKDKECKDAILEDLEKSKNWRINRLLWKTHEYKLDTVIAGDNYTWQDFTRAENRWIECLDNIPTKLAEELKVKESQVEEMKESEVQEQLDAMSSLEINGL